MVQIQGINRLLEMKIEGANIDFKESFDISSTREWCEIIKDIIAISNSGGGYIAFGINDEGCLSDSDLTNLINFDSSKISDKIKKYLGNFVPEVSIHKIKHKLKTIVAFVIQPAQTPLIFEEAGTYPIDGGKQNTAFAKGTIYFRHGAKSEPGNSKDIDDYVKLEIERRTDRLLKNIIKVVEAPIDNEIHVLPPDVKITGAVDAMPIRLTTDPQAPVYRKLGLDKMYPFRQKEVVECFNMEKSDLKSITSYDVQVVRSVYKIDQSDIYCYYSKFSPKQFNSEFVKWLLKENREDNEFFSKARQKYKEKTYLIAV